MIYTASIELDPGKSEEEATRTVLRVGRGLVWRIEIEFPPGCAGLAHLRINDGLYQVFPAITGQTFASDGSVIGFDDLYFKLSEPFEFVITAWNEDEAWPHTLQVRVAMASSDAFMSRYMPSIAWDKFSETMKEAAKIQEKEKQAQIERLTKEIGEE